MYLKSLKQGAETVLTPLRHTSRYFEVFTILGLLLSAVNITHIGYSGVFGRFYLKEGEYKPTCGHYYNDENTAWSVNPKQLYSF